MPSGSYVENLYEFDDLGRPKQIQQKGDAAVLSKTVKYEYVGLQLDKIERYENLNATGDAVVATNFDYFADGRLDTIDHWKGEDFGDPGSQITWLTLLYDSAGRVAEFRQMGQVPSNEKDKRKGQAFPIEAETRFCYPMRQKRCSCGGFLR